MLFHEEEKDTILTLSNDKGHHFSPVIITFSEGDSYVCTFNKATTDSTMMTQLLMNIGKSGMTSQKSWHKGLILSSLPLLMARKALSCY